MKKEEYAELKPGDMLIVTQHGKDRGKLCTVICPNPNYRGVKVRLITEGETFSANGLTERIMAHESLGFLTRKVNMPNKKSDYKHGEEDAFKLVISLACGFQNDIGCDAESEAYKAYQKIILAVKKNL